MAETGSRWRARVHVIAVGKIREPHAAVASRYEDRIDDRVGLRVDEVAAEPLQHGLDQVARREADRIRARLPDGAYLVAMDPAGRVPASSEALAKWLERRLEQSGPTVFLIGGASGLAPDLLAEADERMSLSPLTLPHQLARAVLAEQLYRALAQTNLAPTRHSQSER